MNLRQVFDRTMIGRRHANWGLRLLAAGTFAAVWAITIYAERLNGDLFPITIGGGTVKLDPPRDVTAYYMPGKRAIHVEMDWQPKLDEKCDRTLVKHNLIHIPTARVVQTWAVGLRDAVDELVLPGDILAGVYVIEVDMAAACVPPMKPATLRSPRFWAGPDFDP